MSAIGNLIWFIFGGVFMGLVWWFAGCLAYISVVGIPWGKACFVIGKFAFFPFGKEAINRKELNQEDDIGTGTLGLIGNVVWFIFAGLWIAIGHVISALLCFITIFGIPFGIQHLKLANIALSPIVKTIVTKEVAAAARKANAEATVTELRSKHHDSGKTVAVKKLLAENDLHAIARFIGEQEKMTSGQIRVSIRQRRARKERGLSIEDLARKEFHALGMTKTSEHTGILIFLLLEDKKFHILADEGIHRKVDEGTWQTIANEMARHFSEQKFREGIFHGVRAVAAELGKHYPHKPGDKNELSNTVHID